jgi:hypothetical protein
MPKQWHDINEPGFFRIAQADNSQVRTAYTKNTQSYISDSYEDPAQTPTQDSSPEVKLSNPEFVEGEEGFQFNKKCQVRVKVEYLKETFRKKVTFSLFSEFNGEIQDMNHVVEGEEDNGSAEATVCLYYNDAYYKNSQNDPTAKVNYFFKASHPRGKEIESPRLAMPVDTEVETSEKSDSLDEDDRLKRLNEKFRDGKYELGKWDCSAFVSYVLFNGNPRITTSILLEKYTPVNEMKDWDVLLFQYTNKKGEPRTHMVLYYDGDIYEHRDYGDSWRQMEVKDFVKEVEENYNSKIKIYRP